MLAPDDCEDCVPKYLQRSLDSVPLSTIAFSLTPLILIWIVAFAFAYQRLFPVLSSDANHKQGQDGLPVFNKDPLKAATHKLRDQFQRPSAQRLASLVFSASIGLSTVLVVLLLCEISNTLNPAARGLALRTTLTLLLVLGILVTPALEIHAFVNMLFGPKPTGTSTKKGRPKMRHFVRGTLLKLWLMAFWYIPQTSILRTKLQDTGSAVPADSDRPFMEECLKRVGIIGISLMASLSGFAAVSSLWQTFGVRHRLIRETDIARKEAGLTATEEMLAAKQSRVRAVQRKMSETSAQPAQTGFMGRIIGSVRGGGSDANELKALEMEVSGLQTMRYSLSSSLSTMRTLHAEQQRSRTKSGRMLVLFNTAFAAYCAYRICTTSFSSLRRWWQPTHSSATSDPINNLLAILTTHWDSNLDQAAWSRQISFLLSGVILLASFNAVLQTFRLFARFAPGWLQHAQTSLPLIISQIASAYVVSSALLLRSNLPQEVGGVISEALGAPLESAFVESWFESCFLVAVGLTATGILIGRRVGSGDDWDDDDGIEMGSKRS